MFITTRTLEPKFRTMLWPNTWFLGFDYLRMMDAYLIGFFIWGFILRAETIWQWKGKYREIQRKIFRRWDSNRSFRRRIHRAVNGNSAVKPEE